MQHAGRSRERETEREKGQAHRQDCGSLCRYPWPISAPRHPSPPHTFVGSTTFTRTCEVRCDRRENEKSKQSKMIKKKAKKSSRKEGEKMKGGIKEEVKKIGCFGIQRFAGDATGSSVRLYRNRSSYTTGGGSCPEG